MLASILTTFCFALSAVTASRSTGLLGPSVANLSRLLIAAVLLGAYALTLGQGWAGPGLIWFLLSGFVGFGIGDVALFQAYARIGSRRGVLLAQCLAVPFAALSEWALLGTRLRLAECVAVGLILAGIAMAVRPGKMAIPVSPRVLRAGVGFGVLAALGQAWGAVLSRKAFALNAEAGVSLDGWTSAFQRIGPGVMVAFIMAALVHLRRRSSNIPPAPPLSRDQHATATAFTLANALAGPVLGVGCYQWALSSAPSGLVLAVVAATPIAVMPLSWYLEKDRPHAAGVAGAAVAVGAVAALVWLRS